MTKQFISDHKEQLPNQLTSAEYQELKCRSGIHLDLIKLNFFHLESRSEADHQHNNDGDFDHAFHFLGISSSIRHG